MKTKYLGIESIIILYYDQVTIACNVMLEGENYSEPIYSNIFCDYYELRRLLNLDNSELGNKIKDVVVSNFIEANGENIQIDLPDHLENKQLDWKYPIKVNLKKDFNDEIPFQCYKFENIYNEFWSRRPATTKSIAEDINDRVSILLAEGEKLVDESPLAQQVKIYMQVIEIEPDNITALINISDCLLKMNQSAKAEQFAFRAYQLHKDEDDMAVVNYSSVLIDNKNFQEAIVVLEEEKRKDSINDLIFNNLGYAYFLIGKYYEALENYNLSIILWEKNHLAYCNRGILKYFIFNDEQGIEDLRKAYLYGDYEAGIILQQVIKDKASLS